MAIRYCGSLKISVVYRDVNDYRTVITRPGDSWSIVQTIGAPASGFGTGVAYDSPEAYDRTAHAALSFADSRTIDQFADFTDSGFLVRRSLARKS